jgi:hypothetical protein
LHVTCPTYLIDLLTHSFHPLVMRIVWPQEHTPRLRRVCSLRLSRKLGLLAYAGCFWVCGRLPSQSQYITITHPCAFAREIDVVGAKTNHNNVITKTCIAAQCEHTYVLIGGSDHLDLWGRYAQCCALLLARIIAPNAVRHGADFVRGRLISWDDHHLSPVGDIALRPIHLISWPGSSTKIYIGSVRFAGANLS